MNKNKPIKIYISPANHYKPYVIKGYTEKGEMDKLAPLLVKELNEYEGIEAVLTSVYSSDRQYTGRPEEAKKLGCDVYIALHSNAGGGKGACLFYHPSCSLSKELALGLVKELNRICPIKSNRAVQPAIYAWNTGAFNFGELRVPVKYGIVPVLIEHEFHDTKDGATWIINNLGDIAKADAKAIAEVLGSKKKTISQNTTVRVENGKEATAYIVGDKYTIKSGDKYSNGVNVPSWLYGKQMTISKVSTDRILLAEINSWVEVETTKPISVGDTVKVKKTATHYGAKNGNKKMASFVPGKSFTVYAINEGQLLIGLNGAYTGWVNVADVEQ